MVIFMSWFFRFIMLFCLNLFDFFNLFFVISDLDFSILMWFYVYYFFSWLLKVTLLIMLLNSEDSNILYFFLLVLGVLFPFSFFLSFPWSTFFGIVFYYCFWAGGCCGFWFWLLIILLTSFLLCWSFSFLWLVLSPSDNGGLFKFLIPLLNWPCIAGSYWLF